MWTRSVTLVCVDAWSTACRATRTWVLLFGVGACGGQNAVTASDGGRHDDALYSGPALYTGAAAENLVGSTVCTGWSQASVDAGRDAVDVDSGAPPAQVAWSHRFGGPYADQSMGLAVDAHATTYLLSAHGSFVDFGAGPVVPSDYSSCEYLSSFDALGRFRWSRPVSSLGIRQVAARDDGHVMLLIPPTSWSQDSVASDLVADLGPDGQVLWVRQLGGSSTQVSSMSNGSTWFELVAANPTDGPTPGTFFYWHTIQTLSSEGRVLSELKFQADRSYYSQTIVTPTEMYSMGNFVQPGLIIGGREVPVEGKPKIAIARLDAQGQAIWLKTVVVSQPSGVTLIPASDGGVLLHGAAEGTIDFGDGPLDPSVPFTGFVVHFDATGALVASRALDPGLPAIVVPLPSGGFSIAGRLLGSVNLNGTIVHTANPLDSDSIVVNLDSFLRISGYQHYGNGGGSQEIGQMAADASGALIVAGTFEGKLDLGSGILRSAGGTDVFLGRVQP